jgi:hypothetical protein
MDLYSQLPPQVTKEKFFDIIEESLTNKRFEVFKKYTQNLKSPL